MTTVAALLVTRDARRWLPPLLAGIAAQSRPVDLLVAVDDGSRDDTAELLASAGALVLRATTTATDRTTRIAQNFVQGACACAEAGADVVVLGDHDDMWHVERVAHQVGVLAAAPGALMAASDGVLVDGAGLPTGGTLRTAFPLPAGWAGLSAARQMALALRTSVATGGASALRPAAYTSLDVPPGWLHDRWWSLVALARAGLVVDETAVIDYRVQAAQQVGLDRAAQGGGAVARVSALLRDARRSVAKARDVRTRLRPQAVDPSVAAAITLRNVLSSGRT